MSGWTNLWLKLFGDRRDQRVALREAGFTDEAKATQWALDLCPEPVSEVSDVELVRRIRRERPDLTGATAAYIARQTRTRHA